MVRADEIDGDRAFPEIEELGNSLIVRRYRVPYPERFIHVLDGSDNAAVKAEGVLLGAGPEGLRFGLFQTSKNHFRISPAP
jgi:hypothetical protein